MELRSKNVKIEIEIKIKGPVGTGKGRILAHLKRYLEGDDWLTTKTVEQPLGGGKPEYSFTGTKEV